MGYTIDIYLNKYISRDDIKEMIESELLSADLKGLAIEQYWGFSCEMDIFVEKNQHPKKHITLHAAYGHDYRNFLLAMINMLLKNNYWITNIKYDF